MTTSRNRKRKNAGRETAPTQPRKRRTRKVEGARDGNSPYDRMVDDAMVNGNSGWIHLFVYGTLREGYGLARWLPFTRVPAKIKGRLYFVAGHAGYPVCDVREDGTVYGELVVIPNNAEGRAAVRRTLDMEKGAGYRIKTVDVKLPFADWKYGRAKVCAWERKSRGDLIDSGDYVQASPPRSTTWDYDDEVVDDDDLDTTWLDESTKSSRRDPDGYAPTYLRDEVDVRRTVARARKTTRR